MMTSYLIQNDDIAFMLMLQIEVSLIMMTV